MLRADLRIGRLRLRVDGIDPALADRFATEVAERLAGLLGEAGADARIDALSLSLGAGEARDPGAVARAIADAIRERAR